jgi:hypothetical protein
VARSRMENDVGGDVVGGVRLHPRLAPTSI